MEVSGEATAVARFQKWIEGARPEQAVLEVARHTLQVRLAAVQYYLPLAAEKADEDIENVHQLRVSSRRATAAVGLYAPLLPRREVSWWKKQLRRIRRAAGNARDLDVLAQRQGGENGEGSHHFLADLRRLRKEAQRPLVAIHRKLCRQGRLEKHLSAILPKSSPGHQQRRFDDWAKRRLRKTLKRFWKAAPSGTPGMDRLHLFRIRTKQLRYTIELVSSVFPEAIRTELYPVVEQLQDRLGTLHDHVAALERLRWWSISRCNSHEVEHVLELIEKERTTLDALLSDYRAWWTPGMASDLKARFNRV
jgi:CHAD domain-containing protein